MTTLEMLIDVLSRSRERFDRAFDGVTLESVFNGLCKPLRWKD